MTKIDDALVGRMEALCRKLADQKNSTAHVSWRDVTEARAIVAEMPAPVDPLLQGAREICANHYKIEGHHSFAASLRAGHDDNAHCMRIALSALRRARGEGAEV